MCLECTVTEDFVGKFFKCISLGKIFIYNQYAIPKMNHYITLALLKQSSGCRAINNALLGSLNLTFTQC